MRTKKYSFWGQFYDTIDEAKYTDYSFTEIQERNRIGIFIGGLAFLLVGFSDFLRVGLNHISYLTFGLRILFFLYTLHIFFYWKKKKDLTNIHINAVVFAAGIGAFLNIIIFLLNPDKTVDIIDLLTFPLTLLLIYVFLTIPSHLLFISGIFSSVVYINMVSNFNNISWESVYIISVIVLTINFMGVYITRFLSMARRTEFMRMQEVEELNLSMSEEIEERNTIQDKLIHAYSEMTESMRYASSLQSAMLPDLHDLDNELSESFVMYQPCDIVSGDFYWASTKDDKIIIAVSDCTGHGVRAGFMSIVAIAMLNDIVLKKKIHEAHLILNELKNQVIRTLKQTPDQPSHHDGMDMSICVIDKKKMELQFAGAYNPLLLIRGEQLIEYKGDRMPISYYFAAKPSFTNHVISIMPEDKFYLFSDGYRDQFGGKNDKKYTYKRLKRELLINSNLSMEAQKGLLVQAHNLWKGSKQQTDDIVVLGFKI